MIRFIPFAILLLAAAVVSAEATAQIDQQPPTGENVCYTADSAEFVSCVMGYVNDDYVCVASKLPPDLLHYAASCSIIPSIPDVDVNCESGSGSDLVEFTGCFMELVDTRQACTVYRVVNPPSAIYYARCIPIPDDALGKGP